LVVVDHAAAIAIATQTLAIDQVTAEVVGALSRADIPVVVLKGPSIARWLYPSGGRPYGDTDLLVRVDDHPAAEDVLRSLGFAASTEGFDPLESSEMHGTEFIRGPGPWHSHAASVDLHHNAMNVPASPDEVWDTLTADLDTLVVGGAEVAVLGRASLALHIVVHAIEHSFDFHTGEDLRRAIEVFSFEEWAEGARRARRLGIADALGFGLRRYPDGAAIADQLDLPYAVGSASPFRRHAELAPRGVVSLAVAWADMTPAEKARRIRLVLVPSPAKVRYVSRSRGAKEPSLLVAYLLWWLGLARDFPRAVAFVVRRRLLPARRPTRSEARAALWTVRAIAQTRRGVRRMPLTQVRLPAPPPVPDDAFAGVIGVLRRWPQKCLVRSLVLQRWHAAHGRPQELVIGVTAPSSGFLAHAWLADEDPCHRDHFTELLRNPAPAGR
jgi:hypothetical protein